MSIQVLSISASNTLLQSIKFALYSFNHDFDVVLKKESERVEDTLSEIFALRQMPQLIIIDAHALFDRTVMFCQSIQAQPSLSVVPVLILLDNSDPNLFQKQTKILQSMGFSYAIKKPFTAYELNHHVRTILSLPMFPHLGTMLSDLETNKVKNENVRDEVVSLDVFDDIEITELDDIETTSIDEQEEETSPLKLPLLPRYQEPTPYQIISGQSSLLLDSMVEQQNTSTKLKPLFPPIPHFKPHTTISVDAVADTVNAQAQVQLESVPSMHELANLVGSEKLESMLQAAIEKVVWEVVPALAESIIKQELVRLTQDD